MASNKPPAIVSTLAKSAAALAGTIFTLGVASNATISYLSSAKLQKYGLPCKVCKGVGFYKCKVCKGNATVEWSPIFDPIHINPCLCPTCDGNKVQRCLNCSGKCYVYK